MLEYKSLLKKKWTENDFY